MRKNRLAILAAGGWITASEFVRNELFFKHYWVDHFAGLGLKFATLPVNGFLWTLWSFGLAAVIAKLLLSALIVSPLPWSTTETGAVGDPPCRNALEPLSVAICVPPNALKILLVPVSTIVDVWPGAPP